MENQNEGSTGLSPVSSSAVDASAGVNYGNPTVIPPAATEVLNEMPSVPEIKYAGFWVRFVAYFIDSIVVGIPAGIIMAILSLAIASIVPDLLIRFIGTALGWTYFILMTNKYQATLGKKAVGIIVISGKNDQSSVGRIILRETVGRIVGVLTIGIGYIMAGFTERKQGLHDKIADTVVIYKDPNNSKVPWWAIALALVIPTIAIVGILASIILVSLGSARNKANDAAVKSTLGSAGVAAIIYQDENSTYTGFRMGQELPICSGEPIINVSPDGKAMSIFARSCIDKTRFYCMSPAVEIIDQGKILEVDEKYATSGASTCGMSK